MQENLAALRARGWHVVGPSSGELADGDVGEGRLADPAEIAAAAARILGPRDLAGRRVLVTAGPTREPIDPVRYLSNPSTGKMGFEVARAAARRGAEVLLVSGPHVAARSGRRPGGPRRPRPRRWPPPSWERPSEQDLFVAAAAVSDYRPRDPLPVEEEEGRRRRDAGARADPRHPGHAGRAAGRAARVAGAGGLRRRDRGRGPRTPARSCAGSAATSWWRTRSARPEPGSAGTATGSPSSARREVEEVEGTKGAVADAILDRVVPLLDARRPRP